MKITKLNSTLYLLLLLILICTGTLITVVYSQFVNSPSTDITSLKTNAGEITIMTPENKTYTEPMSGYYPGTFGFESDDVYSEGTDVSFIDLSGNEIQQTIPSFMGHNNVLEVLDNSGSLYSFARGNFTEQEYGTVEFWMSSNDASKVTGAYLGHGVDGQGTLFGIDDGKFRRYYNGWVDIGKVASDSSWYHIRIDFECGSGNYLGLSADTWQVWIDGELFGSFDFRENFDRDNLDYFHFRTFEPDSSYSSYLDAIGYSWDPNYNIGDNLKEGMLLSYENNTVLDWKGYSLDGASNKTILGNTTIPLPSNGVHTIQVFGNNSIGTEFYSSIKYFSLSLINMITPENKTYTEPMSGYYPGTFGFESDKDYVSNTDVSFIDVSGNEIKQVIPSFTGHNKVLELLDSSTSLYSRAQGNFAEQEFGTAEFWMSTNDVTKYSGAYIGHVVDGQGILFGIDNGQFRRYYNGWLSIGKAATDNTWYHIRIDFECGSGNYLGLSADTWQIWIDGELFGSYDFRESFNRDDMDNLYFRTFELDSGYSSYIDAIGYSWDPNYNIGDNLNEGLLLSYDGSTYFDWQAYSLDGAVNKTILGSSTIPFPSDGVHNIQVFGNNTMGILFESNLRYFTIDTISPIIAINSPSIDEYFRTSAPNFDISIIELNLNKSWYTIDNGVTNITFTGSTGTINQTEWDKKSDGSITIRFYARDHGGNENSTEVVVNKDITFNSL